MMCSHMARRISTTRANENIGARTGGSCCVNTEEQVKASSCGEHPCGTKWRSHWQLYAMSVPRSLSFAKMQEQTVRTLITNAVIGCLDSLQGLGMLRLNVFVIHPRNGSIVLIAQPRSANVGAPDCPVDELLGVPEQYSPLSHFRQLSFKQRSIYQFHSYPAASLVIRTISDPIVKSLWLTDTERRSFVCFPLRTQFQIENPAIGVTPK